MTDKKISELSSNGTLDGTELVYVAQLGADAVTTVQDIKDFATNGFVAAFVSYTALRAYTGSLTSAVLNGVGIAGIFVRDTGDSTSLDDGYEVIVDASNRRWKRKFSGKYSPDWLGNSYKEGQLSYPSVVGASSLILAGVDSLTAGAYSSTWRTSFLSLMRGQFGDCGAGFIGLGYPPSVDSEISFYKTSNVTYVDIADGIYGQYSLDGYGCYIAGGDGTTDYLTYRPKNQKWTTCRVFYLKQPGGGTFLIKITSQLDATGTTVDTSNGSLDIGYVDIAYPTSLIGTQGIYLGKLSGNVCLFAVHFKNADVSPNVTFGNLAKGGRTLQSVAEQDSAIRQKWFQLLTPSHYILNAGMNDRTTRTAAQHYTDLETIVNDIQIGSPNTQILIVQSNEPSDAKTTYFSQYYAQKVALAAAKKCSFIDLRNVMGNYAQAVAFGLMQDGIHPNAIANAKIAVMLADWIGLSRAAKDLGLTDYTGAATPVYNRTGNLTTVNGSSVTVATSVLLYKLGLINGYPNAVFKFRVTYVRYGTAYTTTKNITCQLTNSNVINVVTQISASPTLTTEHADAGGDDFTMSCTIVSGFAEIRFTPATYLGDYIASGSYVFPHLTVTGQSVYEN